MPGLQLIPWRVGQRVRAIGPTWGDPGAVVIFVDEQCVVFGPDRGGRVLHTHNDARHLFEVEPPKR